MTELVLVLRALGLGDGLTGIPALRGLRRLVGPGARIVLAAPAGIGAFQVDLGLADELLVTPDLDEVADRWRAAHPGVAPDLAVDLHGRGPRSHRLLQSLGPGRLLAWRCPAAGHPDGPAHEDGEHEVLRWCRLVTWAGGACGPDGLRLPPPSPWAGLPAAGSSAAAAGDVVVHPGAAAGSRRWPVERFAAVAAELAARGHRVLVTGSAGERAITAAVAAAAPGGLDLAGHLDLAGLAAVVAGAVLVVSGDTGTAHLATAYGVASVLLFGPTPPAWWGPAIDVDRHRVLWHGPALAPAGHLYLGDPHGDEVDPALARVTVDEVLAAAGELLPRRA